MKNLIAVMGCLLMTSALWGQNKKDEKAIHVIIDEMATAWTSGNGEGFAQHFAEEHDYFVWNGLYTPNMTKAQNSQAHQRLFDTQYKDTQHYAVVDKVRFITSDVAVALVMSAVVPANSPVPEYPQVLWSATLKKDGNNWKIVSFHNADIEILENAESRANSPIPVEVMYKSWFARYAADK